VTASKMDLPQDQMTQASSVITAPRIQAQAATSVTDTLRQEPAFSSRSAAAGQAIPPCCRLCRHTAVRVRRHPA